MKVLDYITKIFNGLNKIVAKIAQFLVIVLIGIVVIEVVSRYFLNQATLYGFDMVWMLYAAHFMLGLGYTNYRDEHVRVDIIFEKFSEKTQSIMEILGYIIFFFPAMIVLSVSTYKYFNAALSRGMTSPYSLWQPYVWPIRLIGFIGIFLLLLQGICKVIDNIKYLTEEGK